MATTAQIEQELLDWYNGQDEIIPEEDGWGENEATEYFDSAWSGGDYSIYEHLYSKDEITIPSGKVELVREIGGGEGEGSEHTVIFSVGRQYFEMQGYYSSWNGTSWESSVLTEVEPKEVKVIRFFPKEG